MKRRSAILTIATGVIAAAITLGGTTFAYVGDNMYRIHAAGTAPKMAGWCVQEVR